MNCLPHWKLSSVALKVMDLPKKLDCRQWFIKKARNFCKYYIPYGKEPTEMLRNTLVELENIVDNADSMDSLTPLDSKIKGLLEYQVDGTFFQIQVQGELNRYILYRPVKFLESSDSQKFVAVIYDLVYIPNE